MIAAKNSQILRAISILITVCLVSFPVQAKFAGGTGQPADPYQIALAKQLISIGSDPNLLDKHFLLLNDIDLDPNLPGGKVFTCAVIAPDTKTVSDPEEIVFTGSFDGNEHCIKNLTLRNGTARHLGLFGIIGSEGRVTYLRIENATITGGENSRYLGALVGTNQGAITNCRTTGRIAGEDKPGDLRQRPARFRTRLDNPEFVGGLAGDNEGTVSNCYAVSTVIGGWRCVSAGGLVALSGGDISNCYAGGEVIDGSDSAIGVGGLVGGNGGTITHSYATAKISAGERTDHPGGLVGSGTGIATQCFWDTQTSGLKVSAGGTGLTTTQMMDPKIYSRNGWAGNPNWVIDPGHDYPRLSWEEKAGQTIPETALDWLGGSGTLVDPYVVSTADQLAMIGKTSLLWDKHFVLANDIDLDPNLPGRHVFTESVISPDLTPSHTLARKALGLTFTGTFDGNGHTLYNLTLDNGEKPTSYVGLFGIVGAEGRVINLGLVNINVRGITSKYLGAIGTLAGYNLGSVTRCYAAGVVAGDDDIGGLVGKNNGSIVNCYTTVEVTGNEVYGIGGLVGSNLGMIADCYARGSVIGRGRCGLLGGLVGCNYRNGGGSQVTCCYSTGRISSGKGSFDLGGLMGANYGTVTNCFWDIETSSILVSDGGMGLTTAQMMSSMVYSLNGWADNPHWVLDTSKDYPHLVWEGASGKTIPKPTFTWLEGSGTQENPYVVGTSKQLAIISMAAILWDKSFVLAAELDLAGIDIRPIGAPGVFTGSFAGDNHLIRNLTIDACDIPLSYVGLFGTIGPEGRVSDLGLQNVAIATGAGSLFCGALAGNNNGTITNCYTTGAVTGNVTLGGLVGANAGTITQSYTTCVVNGSNNSHNVGGLIGYNTGNVTNCYATGDVINADMSYSLGGLVGGSKGTITKCYANGNVTAGVESHDLGGLIGDNKGTIANCYATGDVSAGDKSFPLAGLVGSNGGTIRNCYSVGRVGASRAVGGLVGTIAKGFDVSPAAMSSVVRSFWDINTSGQRRSTGGLGKTTAKMRTAGTFLNAGWDFVGESENGTEDIWWILEGQGYPRLRWELAEDNAAMLPKN